MGRLLIFSNPLAYSSGYSCQLYHLCKVLLMMGHELFLIDCALPKNNTQKAFKLPQLRQMYASQHPEFCENLDERADVCSKVTFVRYMYDTFPAELYVKDFNALIKEFKIDYMLFFIDIWIIKTGDGVRFDCPAVTWLPIHFDPVEERTRQAAELFDKIVCLAKDGVDKITALFPDKQITRVPHIIDFAHYNLDKVDKIAIRKSIQVPEDCWLVSMVMNNSESTNRKCFCANLEGFKRFHDKYPKSHLYLHSKIDGALNLQSMLDYYGINQTAITISDKEKMAKGGYKFDWVVNLYKVTDCLLNATCSEGFSIPVIEAQAVGTPVISTNTTAPPDNTYNGLLADVYSYRFCYQNASYWATPDVKSIVKCLEKIYKRTPEETKNMSRYGMKMIRENYNQKTLYDGWKPIFHK